MIHFVNDGDTGFVATNKEVSFIIGDNIVGPFPNRKKYLLLLIDFLESSWEKNEPDKKLMKELAKERSKYID